MLSHQRVGGAESETCKSVRSIQSQDNSTVEKAMALYSDFVLDLETTSYFLALHEIK